MTFVEHMRTEAQKYLQEALRNAGGSVTEAARASGLNRTHFYRMLNKLGMDSHPRRIPGRGNEAWRALPDQLGQRQFWKWIWSRQN